MKLLIFFLFLSGVSFSQSKKEQILLNETSIFKLLKEIEKKERVCIEDTIDNQKLFIKKQDLQITIEQKTAFLESIFAEKAIVEAEITKLLPKDSNEAMFGMEEVTPPVQNSNELLLAHAVPEKYTQLAKIVYVFDSIRNKKKKIAYQNKLITQLEESMRYYEKVRELLLASNVVIYKANTYLESKLDYLKFQIENNQKSLDIKQTELNTLKNQKNGMVAMFPDNVRSDKSKIKITFYKVNGKGILLGKNIKLLNENFKEVKDLSYLKEQFVDIKEVSEEYHKIKPTDDYCQEFKYVKIKTKDFEGYIDGRKIYEPIKNAQNKIVNIDNIEISFTATNYFGIKVANDDGLTGCSVKTPVVFLDKLANYEGLVKMVKNKYYESDYPYFELKDDDDANDQILSIDRQGDKYILKIKRNYQEGGANLLVEVYKDKSETFVAEIIAIDRIED